MKSVKLSKVARWEIRQLHKHGAEPRELALVYGVGEAEIYAVLQDIRRRAPVEWPGADCLPWHRDPEAWSFVDRNGAVTLERIAEAMGTTKERIRQVQASAFRKLGDAGLNALLEGRVIRALSREEAVRKPRKVHHRAKVASRGKRGAGRARARWQGHRKERAA